MLFRSIKHSREIAGYTQEKLADLTDVSIQYISDLERGIVGTSIPTLIKICETLNVSSDFILMGRTKENNLSNVQNRLLYLPESQIKLVERGINLILEAVTISSNTKSSENDQQT